MEDQWIIELYFARDEQAILETEKKYGKLCSSIAYNILNDREDAAECVNDTYLGLWNAIPPTRPHNLLAFACKITRNLSLKRLEAMMRQKRARGTVVSLEELSEVLADDRFSREISTADIGNAISAFLRAEKADVRNVFLRKYYFFDSISEIADRFGYSESKVKNMLYHTRKKLKAYLIKEGVEV